MQLGRMNRLRLQLALGVLWLDEDQRVVYVGNRLAHLVSVGTVAYLGLLLRLLGVAGHLLHHSAPFLGSLDFIDYLLEVVKPDLVNL